MRALMPHTASRLKPAQPHQAAGWPLPSAGLSLCPSLPPYLPCSGVPCVPTGAWQHGKLGCARLSYFYPTLSPWSCSLAPHYCLGRRAIAGAGGG